MAAAQTHFIHLLALFIENHRTLVNPQPRQHPAVYILCLHTYTHPMNSRDLISGLRARHKGETMVIASYFGMFAGIFAEFSCPYRVTGPCAWAIDVVGQYI